jgi:hypothetical protein
MFVPADWTVDANPMAPPDSDEMKMWSADGKRTVLVTISTPSTPVTPESMTPVAMQGARSFVMMLAEVPQFSMNTIVGRGAGNGPTEGELWGRKGFLAEFDMLPPGAKSAADGKVVMKLSSFMEYLPETKEVLSINLAIEEDPKSEVEPIIRSLRVLPRSGS